MITLTETAILLAAAVVAVSAARNRQHAFALMDVGVSDASAPHG